jgi:hypothetical protein
MAGTEYSERITILGPPGLSAAIEAAAAADFMKSSEWARRAILARLRDVGMPLRPTTRVEQPREVQF